MAIRLTQQLLLTGYTQPAPELRTTALAVEVVKGQNSGEARVTAAALEVIRSNAGSLTSGDRRPVQYIICSG